MKGSQRKWQSNSTDSVIGMLMGFDEPPPQGLVPDKFRALSESYLHKVASVSLRSGSSVSIRRSCSTNNEMVDEVKGVSRVRSSNVLDKCVNSSRSNVTSLEPSSASVSLSNKTEHCAARSVLRRHQKLEHDFEDVKFDKHSTPEYRELGKSVTPEIGKPHHEFTCKGLVVNGNVSGDSCVTCNRSTSTITPERRRSKFEPHLLLDQSLADKSRKTYFERRKTAKKVQKSRVSKFARNLDMKVCTNDFYSPSSLQSRSSDRCKEFEPSLRNPESSISNLATQYKHDASYDSEEAVNAEDFTRINRYPLLKSYPGILLEEGVHASKVEEVVSREASQNELSEEESAYSKCSLENLRRTSQLSPNSVLESHDTNNPSPFDSIGLMLQLQALNFDLEESPSEGSTIMVSGDEDLGDLSHYGRKIKRWLGDEESRNFSYLIDVLDEAGFYDTNSFMDFNKWDSLECPISPSEFDALEKKYGKQTSWQKSERLLLFDRINSGLLGIYYPVVNFHDGAISFRKKLCSSFRRDEVEEELWRMLIGQENGRSKDLSEQALDNWWEFKEGVSIICGELEASLFDELVMELASL